MAKRVMDDAQVAKARKLVEQGLTLSQIATRFGVSRRSLQRELAGENHV